MAGKISQTVRQSVNKGLMIGVEHTTSGVTVENVVTAATIAGAGGKMIRDVFLKVTLANGYLGLGKDAAGAVGVDIIFAPQDETIDLRNCKYPNLTVIREAGTDVKLSGYVVIS